MTNIHLAYFKTLYPYNDEADFQQRQKIADLIDKKVQIINKISCIYCGCTQNNACIDEHGSPCSWVEIDYNQETGICSACFNKN